MNNLQSLKSAPVFLVGAGPGDPGAITVRGVECLRCADVVLYDYLVNPAVLRHAPATAELVCLGHHRSGRNFSPDDIVARMLAEAKAGRTVVRLKGGDPSIFGRCADETGALRAEGVPFEIVPGITAGLAAAAFCEIPITHHNGASAVALITGHERCGKSGAALDYGRLADFPGTLIIYMGVTRAAVWSGQLIGKGKPPDTPVAIVRWCGCARQRTLRCTLGDVGRTLEEHRVRPPVVFVVGDVVDHAPDVSWFASRPLFGVRVLIASTLGDSRALEDRLVALGAEVTNRGLVRTSDPPDQGPIDTALARVERYDWVVFTSELSVAVLAERLVRLGADLRRLAGVKLCAVGAAGADALSRFHLRPDSVLETGAIEPADGNGTGHFREQRVLLLRAGDDAPRLRERLQRAGALVEEVCACTLTEHRQTECPDADSAVPLRADWIVATDQTAIRALAGTDSEAMRDARFISTDGEIAAEIRELGYEPVAIIGSRDAESVVGALLKAMGTIPPPDVAGAPIGSGTAGW